MKALLKRLRPGPSPHARGTRQIQHRGGEAGRSIPACAGNTPDATASVFLESVHPRMRGEHVTKCDCFGSGGGPSPHARGTPQHRRMEGLGPRSIPACAGNTDARWTRRIVGTVHPRMRGEHVDEVAHVDTVVGPSPHARGTPACRQSRGWSARSIPACAGNTLTVKNHQEPRAVHPRMRGEHAEACAKAVGFGGPSPHARGTLGHQQSNSASCPVHPRMRGEHGVVLDHIPWSRGPSPHARGTRIGGGGRGRTDTVHPRMRGEHFASRASLVCDYGPSPHARGTRLQDGFRHWGTRSIPACAGNTSNLRAVIPSSTVHPRMRGEHAVVMAAGFNINGPSPHARGTRGLRRDRRRQRRSIPACAGNTYSQPGPGRGLTVHPRMRGEHRMCSTKMRAPYGPSPHARGTQQRSVYGVLYGRSIPACAGNTRRGRSGGARSPVHPRMRGEHVTTLVKANGYRGPSPHARGTRSDLRAQRRGLRSIPACAGNTASSMRGPSSPTVHPRMRGEHAKADLVERYRDGPSPHARGTRLALVRLRAVQRSIPACAGNTCARTSRNYWPTVHPRMRGEHSKSSAHA